MEKKEENENNILDTLAFFALVVRGTREQFIELKKKAVELELDVKYQCSSYDRIWIRKASDVGGKDE